MQCLWQAFRDEAWAKQPFLIDAESAAGGSGPGFIAGAFTMADVEQVRKSERAHPRGDFGLRITRPTAQSQRDGGGAAAAVRPGLPRRLRRAGRAARSHSSRTPPL